MWFVDIIVIDLKGFFLFFFAVCLWVVVVCRFCLCLQLCVVDRHARAHTGPQRTLERFFARAPAFKKRTRTRGEGSHLRR